LLGIGFLVRILLARRNDHPIIRLGVHAPANLALSSANPVGEQQLLLENEIAIIAHEPPEDFLLSHQHVGRPENFGLEFSLQLDEALHILFNLVDFGQ